MIKKSDKSVRLAPYNFCSFCGGSLVEKKGNLSCEKCSFVNYRNPRPTATGIVVHKGKILLTKRAREPFKGWWDLPGGFLDHGEHPEKALIRELREETGLKVKIKKLFGIYTGTYPSDTEPFYIISMIYIAESESSRLKALDDVSESRWFSKKEIPKEIAFDSNQEVINNYKKIWN